MNLYNESQIKKLLSDHGFFFKKKFGQNFLINESVVERAASEARKTLPEGLSACIEIGPGIGSLTQKLSDNFDKVICIEIDESLKPLLEKTVPRENVEIIFADFLKVDLKALFEEKLSGYNVCVCANLPYYITTPIIMALFESRMSFFSVTVMTQKEVARRFTAPPNSEEYGAITAVCSYYAKATRLFDVSRGNFVPAPNVTSSVVTFLLYKERPVSPKDEKMFFDVIKGSFANRRKTIYNSLSSFFVNTFSKEEIEKALTLSGIPLNTRGEALSIKEFSALSDALYEIKNN